MFFFFLFGIRSKVAFFHSFNSYDLFSLSARARARARVCVCVGGLVGGGGGVIRDRF